MTTSSPKLILKLTLLPVAFARFGLESEVVMNTSILNVIYLAT
jgi:hypothetical protein